MRNSTACLVTKKPAGQPDKSGQLLLSNLMRRFGLKNLLSQVKRLNWLRGGLCIQSTAEVPKTSV